MRISGLQKTTLQDFPGNLSAIVFTQGCNYRCPFCQNSRLVLNKEALIDEDEIFDYLNKRKNILEGVVISGGEPTVQADLKDFIKKVKSLGLKVKLDTNGTNPDLLEDLINNNLLDYIAMDIKHSFEKYETIVGEVNPKLESIKKSIELIKESSVDFEFRTTIVKEFHTILDLENILNYIGDAKYYIQNFEDSENVLDRGLHGFAKEELMSVQEKLRKKSTNVKVRGL